MELCIGLCDDDGALRDRLSALLAQYLTARGRSYTLLPFSSGEALMQERREMDLLFLDVQMPGINGLDAARRLRERGGRQVIVFLTVLAECVYDAFEVEASGYLLKPVDPSTLFPLLDRVLAKMDRERGRVLAVQSASGCETLRLGEILYCEVMDRKVYLHTKNRVVDYYNRLDRLAEQLGPGFFRCHRSYLLNLAHVTGCRENLARLDNGEEVPVARGKKQELIAAMLRDMRGGEEHEH